MPQRPMKKEKLVAAMAYVDRNTDEVFSRLSYSLGKSKSEWMRDACLERARRHGADLDGLLKNLRLQQKGKRGIYVARRP